MAEQQFKNELHGYLYRNKEPQTERSPDARGGCQINGQKYWISGWSRKDKDGKKYLALAFTIAKSQESDKGEG